MHDRAVRYLDEQLGAPTTLYTSNLVVAETLAHLTHRKPAVQHAVIKAVEDFRRPEGITILSVHGQLLSESLQRFATNFQSRQSLVDVSNVLLMEREGITRIFCFDSYYDGQMIRRGYQPFFLSREPI